MRLQVHAARLTPLLQPLHATLRVLSARLCCSRRGSKLDYVYGWLRHRRGRRQGPQRVASGRVVRHAACSYDRSTYIEAGKCRK